jgi:hypothetical protein
MNSKSGIPKFLNYNSKKRERGLAADAKDNDLT